jgi:hypothetical protein
MQASKTMLKFMQALFPCQTAWNEVTALYGRTNALRYDMLVLIDVLCTVAHSKDTDPDYTYVFERVCSDASSELLMPITFQYERQNVEYVCLRVLLYSTSVTNMPLQDVSVAHCQGQEQTQAQQSRVVFQWILSTVQP